MPEIRSLQRLLPIFFALVALLGSALRIYPSSSFTGIGYDEVLYRGYVENLISAGLNHYPDFAEHYLERQQQLPAAILPPTRFLYIFSAYLCHKVSGAEPIIALQHVSCLFSILLLFASGAFAWRVGGPVIGLAVLALMSCAPTQIHMAQHALIDGFFAFWATLSLWFLWENLRRPNDWRWLLAYAISLAAMVLAKENAAFVFAGLVALLALNPWVRFGKVTRPLLLVTVAGPLVGAVILICLCGGAQTLYSVYRLFIGKAVVLPYAIATQDGPWYRYLLDLLLVSPLVFLLALGAAFRLRFADKAILYLGGFIAVTYLLMCHVWYGMNLRFANMWDMPLRYLAVVCAADLSASVRRNRELIMAIGVTLLCAIELRQYHVLFVEHDLYELVTVGLLRAVNIVK